MATLWPKARLKEEPFGSIQVNELLSRTRSHFYAANCGREPRLEWKAEYLVTNRVSIGLLMFCRPHVNYNKQDYTPVSSMHNAFIHMYSPPDAMEAEHFACSTLLLYALSSSTVQYMCFTIRKIIRS